MGLSALVTRQLSVGLAARHESIATYARKEDAKTSEKSRDIPKGFKGSDPGIFGIGGLKKHLHRSSYRVGWRVLSGLGARGTNLPGGIRECKYGYIAAPAIALQLHHTAEGGS